ncbi:MAG: hypothetical protein ABS76_03705 [Pelagibacterium sp. SCN 64-44]|nr:MAG: hypothetical protein ABS76_03705 [Pelagibacterium sp. SCN 64-44]
MTKDDSSGAAKGGVRTMLRLEGMAVFLAATALYFGLEGAWWLYIVLLFAPDLSFAGYAAGNRMGAALYNAAHSIIAPVLIGAAGILLENDLAQQLALIHFAHIGLDRSLGYGLKYAAGFKHTHLGRLGRG